MGAFSDAAPLFPCGCAWFLYLGWTFYELDNLLSSGYCTLLVSSNSLLQGHVVTLHTKMSWVYNPIPLKGLVWVLAFAKVVLAHDVH